MAEKVTINVQDFGREMCQSQALTDPSKALEWLKNFHDCLMYGIAGVSSFGDSCFKNTAKEAKKAAAKPVKNAYGEFKNVMLSDEEGLKLREVLGDKLKSFIEKLSCYKKSKGKKYKDDYATILNWYRKDCESSAATSKTYRQQDAARQSELVNLYTPITIFDEVVDESTRKSIGCDPCE